MNLSDILKYGHQTVLKTVDGLPDKEVVYTFYGHKREHCAQIALFRKRLT